MAQAIQAIHQAERPEAERVERVLDEVRRQVVEDADGLRQTLQLLQAMHDRGVLELFTALFERGDKVLGLAVQVLSEPENVRALKNVITGLQWLTSVDVDALRNYQQGALEGIKQARAAASAVSGGAPQKPLGVFELMKQLKDPDVSAALRVGLAFLKGFGQSMRQPDAPGSKDV
ncbi:hypothetical protein GCM10025857_29980 [Alicyclobacillus contaminans]|uniref:DUF1641 domain-containing protein n=1 Tax=Alicyclobacillus contaminans TaxID=392016 RepID=UPI000428FBFD|nr:DUF1641 domain-containing protein [Alicyclobacillus contaminans]GMA51641.1 hypothetical protein GCM10025857_29980 [Alicyclobacillus contaminans]